LKRGRGGGGEGGEKEDDEAEDVSEGYKYILALTVPRQCPFFFLVDVHLRDKAL
jgi:hypothetical protein